MAVCTVEDDAVWFADVDFLADGSEYHVVRASEPRELCRREFDPHNRLDDQHSIDMDGIIDRFCEAINALPHPAHMAGFSTFGNVHIETGNIFFRPLERDQKSKMICPPQRIDALTAISRGNVIVSNDATAAAVGEWTHGFGRNTSEFAYIWAGRGVNVGLVLAGCAWRGRLHPEAGHVLVRRKDGDTEHKGVCPDHDGCVLGLTCLRSINQRRKSMSISRISDTIGYYLAQLCLDVSLTVAPEKIALGGLLMDRYAMPDLLDNTRGHFRAIKGDYPQYIRQETIDFIGNATTPCAGLWGLIEMARQRLNGRQ